MDRFDAREPTVVCRLCDKEQYGDDDFELRQDVCLKCFDKSKWVLLEVNVDNCAVFVSIDGATEEVPLSLVKHIQSTVKKSGGKVKQ